MNGQIEEYHLEEEEQDENQLPADPEQDLGIK